MHKTIRYRVFENPDSASAQVAAEMAEIIRVRAALGRSVVIGLATGRTTLPLYEELVYLHREENLSFQNVITFNLDEYHGLTAGHPASVRSFMHRNFFDHVDVPPEHIHFPDNSGSDRESLRHCANYETDIARAGGIDYQILGIGRSGHIGFNEPGTSIHARTRRVRLGEITREDATLQFGCAAEVPSHAITMGCATILSARRIALLAWGAHKARIVRKAIQGPVTPKVPASYLQKHPSARFFLDPLAASSLKH